MHKTAYIYRYEGGGYAALCGASIAPVDGVGGLMSLNRCVGPSKSGRPAATIQTGRLFAWKTPPTLEVEHATIKPPSMKSPSPRHFSQNAH